MKDIVDKLDKYDLINHIVPGTIYLLLIDYLNKTSIHDINIIYFCIVAYATGLVIGRIGSLIFQRVVYHFCKDKEYKYEDYIKACSNDNKIDTLVSNKNAYRNMMSSLLLVIITTAVIKVTRQLSLNSKLVVLVSLFAIALIFAKAVLKENGNITKRIEKACGK